MKQLAEAQNDDFQEIITLVGMASKPLHVKRFKKALDDYRQLMNNTESLMNNSMVHRHRLSTDETLNDRYLYSFGLHSTSKNNLFNPMSSNWYLNVSFD